MKPIKDYLFEPDYDKGGAIVPIIGKPGVGKTIALTQIALEGIEEEHIILWRGTKQAQWINIVANDQPVTIWNDKSIQNFTAKLTSNEPGESSKEIDLESKDNIQVKNFEEPSELMDRMDKKRVNVINIAGLQSQDMNQNYELYYFRHKWVEILDELIKREWLTFTRLIIDEAGDIYPSQQQLRKPFYKLIANNVPPKLSQLRKQNTLFYLAAHSTHDMHYMIWKVKGNTIVYMSGSAVSKAVSPSIDQEKVNNLDRGEFIMPPSDKGRFEMPYASNDLPWISTDRGVELRLDWDNNCENLLSKK